MHDIRFIREHPEAFDKGMARRGLSPVAAELLSLDERRRQITTELQGLQTRRNAASKEIGAAKSKGGDAQALMDEVASIKARMGELEQADRDAEAALDGAAGRAAEHPRRRRARRRRTRAPMSSSAASASRGRPNSARDHVDLGEGLGLMDFDAAARLSGARFVVLQGRAGPAGARARPVHARPAHHRARLHRGRAAAAGARRGGVRHRPAAEVRRGPVPHQRPATG